MLRKHEDGAAASADPTEDFMHGPGGSFFLIEIALECSEAQTIPTTPSEITKHADR